MAAFLLLQLPFEEVDGNPVPRVVFSKRPARFHAYLLALNFAFTGAVMTMSYAKSAPKPLPCAGGLLAWLPQRLLELWLGLQQQRA